MGASVAERIRSSGSKRLALRSPSSSVPPRSVGSPSLRSMTFGSRYQSVPSGDQHPPVGQRDEVGTEHVAVVLGVVVGRGGRVATRGRRPSRPRCPRGRHRAGRGLRPCPGARRRGDWSGLEWCPVARSPRSWRGSVNSGVPFRRSRIRTWLSRADPAVLPAGLGPVLGVLGALEAVVVEDPPVGEDGRRLGGGLAHDEAVGIGLGGRDTPGRVGTALLERRGPRTHHVGPAGSRPRTAGPNLRP